MDEKLKEKIDTLKDRIKWAGNLIKDSEKELKELEKQLEDEKRPMAYFTRGKEAAISKYKKYSDIFVEFEVADVKYRCVFVQEYPKTGLWYNFTVDDFIIVGSRIEGLVKFEAFHSLSQRWVEVDNVQRIKLLEGVNEYEY